MKLGNYNMERINVVVHNYIPGGKAFSVTPKLLVLPTVLDEIAAHWKVYMRYTHNYTKSDTALAMNIINILERGVNMGYVKPYSESEGIINRRWKILE